MDARFEEVVASLHPSFKRLLAATPVSCTELPRTMSTPGIYLLSEGGRHLYVGRSKDVKARLKRQSQPSSSHKKAAFAFRLAREATGNTRATYRPTGSRGDLITEPAFQAAFESAKARIRKMDVRFVEEPDAIRQTILEVYVAVVLGTPYNDFDTH